MVLEREGIYVNLRKLRRNHREDKLLAYRQSRRQCALGTRRPVEVPTATNACCSLDFVRDTSAGGRRFRILAVASDFIWGSPALTKDIPLLGSRAVRELQTLCKHRG